MKRRVLLVAMMLSLSLAASGCYRTVGPASSQTVEIDTGDSGTGGTIADRVYNILGSQDGGWIEATEDYDPVSELDLAVRAAARRTDAITVDSVVATSPVEAAVSLYQWTFLDGSKLTYASLEDATKQRWRIKSVNVYRPRR